MRTFPFISLPASLVVMRVCVAALFIAHAVVRMANGSIPGFGTFLEKLGFPAGVAVVWVITTVEIVAGTLMAVGWHARWMASALFVIAAGGILLIHRHLGWFVGEHGTGRQRVQRVADGVFAGYRYSRQACGHAPLELSTLRARPHWRSAPATAGVITSALCGRQVTVAPLFRRPALAGAATRTGSTGRSQRSGSARSAT
jgi:putative oxidoreductase